MKFETNLQELTTGQTFLHLKYILPHSVMPIASLKKLMKKIVEARSEKEQESGHDAMQELVTNVQFANDEGDPGMGLELGLNAFTFGGSQLHSYIKHLLGVAYELLGRSKFSQIIQVNSFLPFML